MQLYHQNTECSTHKIFIVLFKANTCKINYVWNFVGAFLFIYLKTKHHRKYIKIHKVSSFEMGKKICVRHKKHYRYPKSPNMSFDKLQILITTFLVFISENKK